MFNFTQRLQIRCKRFARFKNNVLRFGQMTIQFRKSFFFLWGPSLKATFILLVSLSTSSLSPLLKPLLFFRPCSIQIMNLEWVWRELESILFDSFWREVGSIIFGSVWREVGSILFDSVWRIGSSTGSVFKGEMTSDND